MPPAVRRRVAAGALLGLLAGSLSVGSAVVATPPADAGTVSEVYPRPANGVFAIRGHGWGHAHGMSQWGAQGAATLGKSADTITATYYPSTVRAVLGSRPIRVQLRADDRVDTVVVAASGLTATDLASGATATLPSGPARWRVTVDSAGLHLSSLTGSTWTAYALAGRSALAGPVRFSGPTFVRLVLPDRSSRDYRGAVQAVKNSSSALTSVAVMSMEQYLLGVVPRESSASWKPAALQAQAIAARSYSAYKRAHVASTAFYDICDTTACQVFTGSRGYTSTGTVTQYEAASTTSAVNATAGVIRAYKNGPIFAEFSSSNGGWSTDGGQPYLVAKADPWDGVAPNSVHTWNASLRATDLERRFPAVGTLTRMRVVERDGHGEWGGRVLGVVLEGYDGTGAATSVSTTGRGVYQARTWPATSDGLKSSWWTVVPNLAAQLIGQSKPPRLVQPPGASTGALSVIVENTGASPWPVDGLHLALASPAGGADPLSHGSKTPGEFVGNRTHPGADPVAVGDQASFRVPIDAGALPAGVRTASYRVRIGTGSLFGPVLTWQVPIDAPRFTAVQDAAPRLLATTATGADGAPPALFADARTVVVPRSGSTTLRLTAKNTGNLTWPVDAATPVELGASEPRDRSSASSGVGWVSTARPARVAASTAVAPGSAGTFDLKLYGNDRPVSSTPESFEPVWQSRSWMSGALTRLLVVRVDPAVSRAAVTNVAPAPSVTLVNAPTGTHTTVLRLRNVGGSPWPVGAEQLGSTATSLATGWPSSTRTPPLAANVSRPGQSQVYPGEVGEWRIPLTGYRKAYATSSFTVRAVGPSGPYGPSYTVKATVVKPVFTASLFAIQKSISVPSKGSTSFSYYVKNTGNVDWPVGGSLRSTVPSGSSPSRASSWLSASRPGTLTSSYSSPGSAVVRPGQIARFVVVLAGNGRTPRSTSEVFGMSWDGWSGIGLRATVPYRVV